MQQLVSLSWTMPVCEHRSERIKPRGLYVDIPEGLNRMFAEVLNRHGLHHRVRRPLLKVDAITRVRPHV